MQIICRFVEMLSLQMKKCFLFFGVVAMLVTTSCIPHKDTIYLQNKGTALDTTRVLQEVQKPYRVQINDILNIRVKALDQENVDIINGTPLLDIKPFIPQMEDAGHCEVGWLSEHLKDINQKKSDQRFI